MHLSRMHSEIEGSAGKGSINFGGRVEIEKLLDNPIWNALRTEQRTLAISQNGASRFPPAIGPLAGSPDQSLESYDALRVLAGPGGLLVLFLPAPPLLPGAWSLFREGILTQMVCPKPARFDPTLLAESAKLRSLGPSDIPAMIELATLTEPGPFRDKTIDLGNFYGVFVEERLMAMAGQRMRLPGFVEVSAVCTHPDARGRGYAGILMSRVTQDIRDEGKTPFLHAYESNPAVSLYRKLGFTHRRTLRLAVIKRED